MAGLFQLGEIGNHRGPLAAEGKVDEVLDILEVQLVGHGLELLRLAVVEAVQALRQVVKLIHVDHRALESFQNAVPAVLVIHLAVLLQRIADFQRLQHFYNVVIVRV